MDVIEFDDGDIDALQLIIYGIPRQIYERENYFDRLDELSFYRRFRLRKNTVLRTLALIEHELEFPYDINNCVSPINQLLVTLRFYATGNHLISIGDFGGMHTSTVSRIIFRVFEAIAVLYPRFIHLPETHEEIISTQNAFFEIAGFPRVIGAIDCTHIKIQSPGGDDPEIFRNRKQYFSINVQAVCNANLFITNVVARWPGSSHDATIFNISTMKIEFENGRYSNSLLLGDSGYPMKKYLLTPILNPTTPAENLYNESQIRTRNCIERCFGVLKRRFPVLAYGCRLKLLTVLTLIVSTSILNNIAKEEGEDEAPPPDEIDVVNHLIRMGQISPVPGLHNDNAAAGIQIRNNFVRDYFANLE